MEFKQGDKVRLKVDNNTHLGFPKGTIGEIAYIRKYGMKIETEELSPDYKIEMIPYFFELEIVTEFSKDKKPYNSYMIRVYELDELKDIIEKVKK